MNDLKIIKELGKDIQLTEDNYKLDKDKKVIELKVFYTNINDSLFRKILQLTNLKKLELCCTKNITEIPNEISNLSKLKYLNLVDNKIEKISDLILELTSLETLILGCNDDFIEIPSGIFLFYNGEKDEIKELLNSLIKLVNFNEKNKYYITINNKLNIDILNKIPNHNYAIEIETKIKRFFYPIGHGAFYAEKHQYNNLTFTIVYDCGSSTFRKEDKFKPIIEKAFEKDEVIDILFISHFDSDHVNQIKLLNEHTKIKKVVMPLLQEEEIIFLINLYRILDMDILDLIENPEEFFGKETKIIRVRPSDILENRQEMNIESLQHNSEIDSGTLLKIRNDLDWVFIPYNYEHAKRQEELKKLFLYAKLIKIKWYQPVKQLTIRDFNYQWIEFCKNSMINRLKTDTDYTLNVIIEDSKKKVSENNKKREDKIKNIYDKLKGKINQNSMLLYSGILDYPQSKWIKKSYLFKNIRHLAKLKKIKWFNSVKQLTLIDYNYQWIEFCKMSIKQIKTYTNRVSCLYTGDTELKKVKPQIKFNQFWNTIGTIQIPHHGSPNNFDKSILDNNIYMCPMSVPTKNSKGNHPSKDVIDNIKSRNSEPIKVTEEFDTGFVEYISSIDYCHESKSFTLI